MHPRKRIAVLMGGPSAEHEVSLETGASVLRHLSPHRFDAFPVVISREGSWPLTISELKQKTDIAFVAMHGAYGEDGGIQTALATFGIPYTGSRPAASAYAMDKTKSLAILRDHGFPIPEFSVFRPGSPLPRTAFLPLVIKPAASGSSFGTSIIRSWDELPQALEKALKFSSAAILQRYILGKEIVCGVLEINGHPVPLMPTEIIPAKELFYGPKSKRSMDGAWHLTPPRLSAEHARKIRALALAAHTALGCSGMSQTDMIVDGGGKIHLLEVNAIPKLSGAAPFSQGAQALGIDPQRLFEHIITSAHFA